MFSLRLLSENTYMVFTDLAIVFLACASPLLANQESRNVKAPAPSAAGTARAEREVPAKAAAEFRKSRNAFDEGNIDKAVKYLRNGLALDPANTDAYNDLGVIYYNLNQPDKAIEAFAAMIEIDSHSFRGFLNLSFVYHSLHRSEDAERMARKAIDLQRSDIRARYLLGISLASQHRNSDEALENLRAAAPEFPDVHLEISRMLIEKGDFEHAMESLNTFTKMNKNMEASARPVLAK